jgi:Mg-chelatase subunit ChlD
MVYTREAAMAQLNEFDLAFVVDTTGSMGGLIAAAQRQMTEMIDALASAAAVEMRLGIVEYRDHPPQDTLISRAYPFTADLRAAKKTLGSLKAAGGGDAPEAVFAGLVTASQLAWRGHARRVTVLVGDAPPHGVGSRGDAFPRGCPSGETIHSTSAKLEDKNIRLYAIGLTREVNDSFGQLSTLTGGRLFPVGQGDTAIEQLKKLLEGEFGQLDFDREVHGQWTAATEPSVEIIAERLAVPPARVAAAVSRLSCRNLLAV